MEHEATSIGRFAHAAGRAAALLLRPPSRRVVVLPEEVEPEEQPRADSLEVLLELQELAATARDRTTARDIVWRD